MSETGYCLGLHCGITFAGLKPASLFWLKDGQDKDMVYYRRCFAKKDFRFIAVKRSAGRKLFYVFHRGRLEEILFDKANREFLRGRGYNYDTVGGALKEIKRRLERGDEFPHEVGLFLGYPLEDVRGFIEDARGGVCLNCGYWKVYGAFEEREKLFKRYERCSRCICEKLSCGRAIEDIFGLG